MMEYFSEWMLATATLHRVVTSKNAAGQTVNTTQNIDGSHVFAKWVAQSIQTNQNDKFINSETGKLAITYQLFYVSSVEVFPDITWYAIIGGVKYFIDGIDNIGSFNEVYLFTYHKENK